MKTLIQPIRTIINISGKWKYRLDPGDVGISEAWFRESFADDVLELPGSTNGNRVGEAVDVPPGMNKEAVRSLRQRYRYVGAVWYQREVRIPEQWAGKDVCLYLERVMLESRAWIGDREVGMQDSLSVPHVHELGATLEAGKTYLLTIRVDNRDCRNLGTHPSAFTDETQTIWNGIIGRMELQAFDPIRIRRLQVDPDMAGRSATVRIDVRNRTARPAKMTWRVATADAPPQANASSNARAAAEQTVQLTDDELQTFEMTLDMGEDCPLWDEFDPALHELSVDLAADSPLGSMRDARSISFGMRAFEREGTQFAINGRLTFLRGTLDCCIFPLTGYPPMETAEWTRIYETVKAYGLNHIRFHSWCPPEAAFAAADRIGLYLQVEGPVWMDTWNMPVGSHPDHYRYLPEEAQRIIETYGHHPSFCLFSIGNELNGDFRLLHDIVAELKERDPGGRQLYTLTANWDRPLDEADDFFIAQTVDGAGIRGQYFPDRMADTTMLSYDDAVARRPVPVISHEVGQYTVYPDIDGIAKYTGYLKPTNLESIRQDLADKGLLPDARKFVEGSGMLALQLYRDEIEAALRTPGMGGFQLLDLHDFPGQSTATVGILDAFWESKGLIEPARFRRFCGPTVLLLHMPKRIYAQGEQWNAEIAIAHYGRQPLTDIEAQWTLRRMDGEALDGGKVRRGFVPLGGGTVLGAIGSDALLKLTGPEKLAVNVKLADTDIENEWNIWVYPAYGPSADRTGVRTAEQSAEQSSRQSGSEVLVAKSLDAQAMEMLANGGRVLLLAYDADRQPDYPGKFFPVFWSPVHFTSENPCGIYVQRDHPAFRQFPTERYAEYPWKDLLEHSSSIHLSGDDAGLEPLVQVIPNFYHNKKLANLLECKVGAGKLVVCTIDLERRLEDRHAARQLRASLIAYMESDDFRPAAELQADRLLSWLQGVQEDAAEVSGRLGGSDLALGRSAAASSEMNPGYAAGKGNDGIGHTAWRAADYEPGHWWQVDLGEVRAIAGTRVKFTHEANYLYVIQVSDDAEQWRVAANRTGQADARQVRADAFAESARYVRIVYNGLAPGVSAGHYSFEVFGN